MAEDNIDDILMRLDEIEKLQTELRHLVPRLTSNSSRHVSRQQDLSRGSSTSIRFPSLFTFPVVSNFASSSKNEKKVQKSMAQLNLNEKLTNNSRPSTVNLKNVGGLSKSKSSARETSIFRDLLKSSNIAKPREIDVPNASTSKRSTPTTYLKNLITHQVAKDSQGAIRKTLKSEASRISTNKTLRATGEVSNIRLSKKENHANLIHSSVQTADVRAYAKGTVRSRETLSCLRRKHHDRSNVQTGTLIKRIMERLNYCFVDGERITVSHHHPGSSVPRRVYVSRRSVEKTKAPQVHVSFENIFVN